jgi:hypothetical protein
MSFKYKRVKTKIYTSKLMEEVDVDKYSWVCEDCGLIWLMKQDADACARNGHRGWTFYGPHIFYALGRINIEELVELRRKRENRSEAKIPLDTLGWWYPNPTECFRYLKVGETYDAYMIEVFHKVVKDGKWVDDNVSFITLPKSDCRLDEDVLYVSRDSLRIFGVDKEAEFIAIAHIPRRRT